MRTNNRSFRKRAGLAAIAATLALVVVGCSTGLRPFADGTAQPPPRTRPPVTAAPTPQVTPGATDAPPSSEPTVDPNARTPRYSAFRNHLLRSHAELKPVLLKVTRRADALDIRRLVDALTTAKEWARNEQEWLRLNQPRDCYREMHQVWSAAIAKWADAFAVLESAFEPVDMEEVIRGKRLIDEGAAILEGYMEAPAVALCGASPGDGGIPTHG